MKRFKSSTDKETIRKLRKFNGNTLTQMEFFSDEETEMGEEPEVKLVSSPADAARSMNNITPSASAKKMRKTQSEEKPCYTKKTTLSVLTDYTKRGKLTTIYGYEDHLHDEKYITLMHTYLVYKVNIMQEKIISAVTNMEEDGDGVWDAVFLDNARCFANQCLTAACVSIMGYKKIVIHSLANTAFNNVMNLEEFGNWGKCANGLVYQMCRSFIWKLTLEPVIHHKAFYLHVSFDNNTPYMLCLEDQFGDW